MKIRNMVLTFLLSFIGCFFAFVLSFKFFSIRGIGPLSWEEIYGDFYLFLFISFFCAVIFTIRVKFANENKNNK